MQEISGETAETNMSLVLPFWDDASTENIWDLGELETGRLYMEKEAEELIDKAF